MQKSKDSANASVDASVAIVFAAAVIATAVAAAASSGFDASTTVAAAAAVSTDAAVAAVLDFQCLILRTSIQRLLSSNFVFYFQPGLRSSAFVIVLHPSS